MQIRMPPCDRCRKCARRLRKAMLLFVERHELRNVIGDNDRQQAGRIGGAGIFADAVLAARLLHCSLTAVRRRQRVRLSLRVVDNEAMQYAGKAVVDRWQSMVLSPRPSLKRTTAVDQPKRGLQL